MVWFGIKTKQGKKQTIPLFLRKMLRSSNLRLQHMLQKMDDIVAQTTRRFKAETATIFQ